MQVRWRQHELIFGTLVFLMIGMSELSVLLFPHEATPNEKAGINNYVTHTLIPFLLTYGVPLLLLVLINTWLLPRYLYTPNQLIILPIAAALAWVILTFALAVSYGLRFEYLLGTISKNSLLREASKQGLGLGGAMIIIYLLYLCAREPVIKWISQENAHTPFRVILCNRITATAFLYFGLLIFLAAFDIMQSDGVGILYVFIVLPVIIIIFINLYGLFPHQHRKQQSFFPFARKLAIAPFLLSLLSCICYTMATGNLYFWLLPVQWLILLLIATPLSWLLFIQQKDKLVTLLQLEKDLGKTTADLAFLRSQINPHFLFNTLNTLYGTALQENATRTSTGIQRLGDMMRFLLHDNHRDKILLSRELEYLQNYIALQQLRIIPSQHISIETSIQPCAQDRHIAPMLLIPFVENAFKHGIRLTSPSYIRIHFTCDEKGIYLAVVNSVHTKRNEAGMPEHAGIGLQNVQKRLQLLYPDTHTLHIHQDETNFEIHLQIVLPVLH